MADTRSGRPVTRCAGANESVTGYRIRQWARGAIFEDVDSLELSGCRVNDIRTEFLSFSACQGVLVEKSLICDRNMHPDHGDDPDMIRFRTNGATRPSTDVVIRGNHPDSACGKWAQIIFVRNDLVDQGLASFEDMTCRSILIEGNTVINGHSCGISVGETDGLVIRDNVALSVAVLDGGKTEKSVYVPKIMAQGNEASIKAEACGNTCHAAAGFDEINVIIREDEVSERFDATRGTEGRHILEAPGATGPEPEQGPLPEPARWNEQIAAHHDALASLWQAAGRSTSCKTCS